MSEREEPIPTEPEEEEDEPEEKEDEVPVPPKAARRVRVKTEKRKAYERDYQKRRAERLRAEKALAEAQVTLKVHDEPEQRVPQPVEDGSNPWAAWELTDAEKRDIDAEIAQRLVQERREAAAEKRKQARKDYIQSRIDQARAEAGETQTDAALKRYLAEEVTIVIRMPRARKAVGMGRHDPEPIIFDQQYYIHGHQYTVTRAVYAQLLDVMDKAGRAQRLAEGDSMADFDAQHLVVTHQGGQARGGSLLAPGFGAMHRRPAGAVSA